MASTPIHYQATAPIIQSTDATDRHYIEAQNEDKSRTTKEALDDIKRVHYKEKKKKEKNSVESYQPIAQSHGSVS